MANRTKIKGVKKHRAVGHKTKKNKKSVAERKKIKNLLKRWKKQKKDKLLAEYFHKQQIRAGYGI